ncbi:MAG: translation initiation factor [Deltaproteobacteria bacterium]|nr:translation initiation factor [Deltaproteobacteria bacterium]
MSRKPKISTDGGPALSSNPFASLAGALGDVPPGEAPAPSEASEATNAPDDPAVSLRGKKIVVRREKKGRGGKTATMVEGLELPPPQLEMMARQLRKTLGCGAHVEDATLVVGGAQTTRVRDWLVEQGANRVVIGN